MLKFPCPPRLTQTPYYPAPAPPSPRFTSPVHSSDGRSLLTSERPFGAPHFVRTLNILGLEAPRRRLPLHPRGLPVRRRRWWAILRPGLGSLSPGPPPPASPPLARSALPRGRGGPAGAPEAGRLDPGPLPCPRPRPLPRSRPPGGPHQPPGVAASGMRGFATLPSAPRPSSRPGPRRLAPGLGLGSAVQRPPGPPLPRTGSVRPRPGPPADSLRGLSRSRWRWKLVGINPGREGSGLGVGKDPAPWIPWGCRGSVCAYVLGLRPSRGPSVHLPGPASSVRVAKGEATSETKVSEKERRFPAPTGAVSSSLPDQASGSAPGAPREQRWTPLGHTESLGLGPPPGTPLPTTCTPTPVPPAPAPLCFPDPPPPSGRARIVAKETVPPRLPEAPFLRPRKPGGWPMGAPALPAPPLTPRTAGR
ncbi:uncharacterized protein LOC144578797 [Callithrix jacchus]